MTLANQRIGFIGGGAMAEALAGGLIGSGVAASAIEIGEPQSERCALLRERLGVDAHADNAGVIARSDVIVIAVKPQIVATALDALSHDTELDLAKPLWISIAAGVTLDALAAGLGQDARIVRAMPNTPALVQAGATALCGNAAASDADLSIARALFEGVGSVWVADHEDHLDAVTGLSGSGPAYVFLFLEALIDAGEQQGLPREAAEQLAFQTVYGAAKLARDSDRSPAQLREQVSSKGGTTVAGLAELEAAELREIVARAVDAATRRSRELGKGG